MAKTDPADLARNKAWREAHKEQIKARKAASYQANRERILAEAKAARAAAPPPAVDGDKPCSRCAEVKPLVQFSRCAGTRDGRSYRCKACDKVFTDSGKEVARERSRAWHAANIDRHRENGARWRAENKDAIRQRMAEYRDQNRDEIRARHRAARYESRPHRIAYVKAWVEANRRKLADRAKGYRARNPEASKRHNAIWRARKANADGSYTAQDVRSLFGLQRGKCANSACRVALKRGYHVDHITPLSRGGSNRPSNLQLLCAPCNLRKSAKHPIVWAQENGLLL